MHESPTPFTPVPTASTRHDGWTPAKQCGFIAALTAMGSVAKAARAVGMTARSAHRLRARAGAESFAGAWAEAQDAGMARQLERAIEIATEGEIVPIYYRGERVGERRRFDHRITIAALRALESTERRYIEAECP